MTSQRKHYMTICFRDGGDVEVTHINRGGDIEVTFEQAKYKGFNTLILKLDRTIVSNSGFNNADINYSQSFVKKSAPAIVMESKGLI